MRLQFKLEVTHTRMYIPTHTYQHTQRPITVNPDGTPIAADPSKPSGPGDSTASASDSLTTSGAKPVIVKRSCTEAMLKVSVRVSLCLFCVCVQGVHTCLRACVCVYLCVRACMHACVRKQCVCVRGVCLYVCMCMVCLCVVCVSLACVSVWVMLKRWEEHTHGWVLGKG